MERNDYVIVASIITPYDTMGYLTFVENATIDMVANVVKANYYSDSTRHGHDECEYIYSVCYGDGAYLDGSYGDGTYVMGYKFN